MTDSSVTLLLWKPGFNGGISQTFIITYTDEKEHDLKNIVIHDTGTNVMNLTVHGLSSDTRYTIQLIAVTVKGVPEVLQCELKQRVTIYTFLITLFNTSILFLTFGFNTGIVFFSGNISVYISFAS